MKNPVVAILTDWFPPGYRAGGPIRSTANIAALLGDELDIRVITSDCDYGCAVPYENVPSDVWVRYGDNALVKYLSRRSVSYAGIAAALAEASADCIYLNSMFSAFFTLVPLWLARRGACKARVVLAPRGMLHAGAMQFKPRRKALCLALMKAMGLFNRITFHATDRQEAADISRYGLAHDDHVVVLPNLSEPVPRAVTFMEKSPGTARLIFVSRISPTKNLLRVLDWLTRFPPNGQVHLTIVGPAEDSAYSQQCREASRNLPPQVAVEWLGPVSHEQIPGMISGHHFLVLPTEGENYGHVIVEALGVGRPVVISDKTPWRDLEARGCGWDLALNDGVRWGRTIQTVVEMDQEEYSAYCSRAHAYAAAITDPATLLGKYRDLFANPVAPSR